MRGELMSELDNLAENAKTDEEVLTNLISQYESFILKCASSVAHNYVSKYDDEYSVALGAFTEAVDKYSADKGRFLTFAELVIRRRLIDYIRSKSRYAPEIPMNPIIFNSETDDEEDYQISAEVAEKIISLPDNSIKLEIELASEVFSGYGFSFYDLAACSPKAMKTKKSCAKAAAYIIKNPILLSNMKVKKVLPLNIIEKGTNVPRKLLERHRKYIIAAIEIVSGEYEYLSDYMPYVVEELSK
jgi:RNA polymerase sigma factor